MARRTNWTPIADQVVDAAADYVRLHGTSGLRTHLAERFHADGVTITTAGLFLQRQKHWPERRAAAIAQRQGLTTPASTLTRTIDAPLSTSIRTLADLLDFHNIDRELWEVERVVVNAYEQGAKGPDGELVVTPLHQIKAWLRRRAAVALLRDLAQSLLADVAAARTRTAPRLVRYTAPDDVLFELAAPDMHLNKFAWGDETGHENYDSAIAENRWTVANTALLERAESSRPARIAIILGNDFFNVASQANQTAAGTPQDVDSRLGKMFRLGRSLVSETIDRALQLAPVECLFVKGNHDGDLVWLLGEVIGAWYRDHPNVTVRNEPTARKYLRWGECLLGFTHGDKEKPASLPLIMATERRHDWSETSHREWHTGHLHKAMKWEDEYGGVRVRRLPSLCSVDAWHAEKGFVGNLKSAEGYLWSKRSGYLGHLNYTLRAA